MSASLESILLSEYDKLVNYEPPDIKRIVDQRTRYIYSPALPINAKVRDLGVKGIPRRHIIPVFQYPYTRTDITAGELLASMDAPKLGAAGFSRDLKYPPEQVADLMNMYGAGRNLMNLGLVEIKSIFGDDIRWPVEWTGPKAAKLFTQVIHANAPNAHTDFLDFLDDGARKNIAKANFGSGKEADLLRQLAYGTLSEIVSASERSMQHMVEYLQDQIGELTSRRIGKEQGKLKFDARDDYYFEQTKMVKPEEEHLKYQAQQQSDLGAQIAQGIIAAQQATQPAAVPFTPEQMMAMVNELVEKRLAEITAPSKDDKGDKKK